MSRSAWTTALPMACAGALLLAAPATTDGLRGVLGLVALAAATVAWGAGTWRRDARWVDAGTVLVPVALALRAPALGGWATVRILAALGVVLVTHAALLWDLRGARAGSAVAKAAPRAVAAAALAAVLLEAPAWTAEAVSARWASSIDVRSGALLGLWGLAFTALAAAWTLARFAWADRGPDSTASRSDEREESLDVPGSA